MQTNRTLSGSAPVDSQYATERADRPAKCYTVETSRRFVGKIRVGLLYCLRNSEPRIETVCCHSYSRCDKATKRRLENCAIKLLCDCFGPYKYNKRICIIGLPTFHCIDCYKSFIFINESGSTRICCLFISYFQSKCVLCITSDLCSQVMKCWELYKCHPWIRGNVLFSDVEFSMCNSKLTYVFLTEIVVLHVQTDANEWLIDWVRLNVPPNTL